MGACLTMAMQVGHSQTLPQLGKDPIEKIVAAMTAEEKVSLLVGTGMPGFGGQSAVVGSTQNIVPGAAGTTFPIERLGIPAIVVADGPAGLRISPTREGNEATYYCTAFPVATLLASTWNTALVKNVGNAMGDEIANVAIITKMIRVMLLVPVLLILGWWAAASARKRLKAATAGESDSIDGTAKAGKGKVQVPWFAFGFLLVIGFNSLDLLPAPVVSWINDFDTFLLTMAMAALGAETSFDKFKQAGAKPFVLATILYVWLLFGGYLITKLLTPILA